MRRMYRRAWRSSRFLTIWFTVWLAVFGIVALIYEPGLVIGLGIIILIVVAVTRDPRLRGIDDEDGDSDGG